MYIFFLEQLHSNDFLKHIFHDNNECTKFSFSAKVIFEAALPFT